MPYAAAIRASAFVLLLASLPLRAAGQQSAADPIIPRGSFYLQLDGRSQGVTHTYDGSSGNEIPLGSGLSFPEIGTAQVPALLSSETRFRALAGTPDGPALRLGATTARVSAEEQAAELQLSYGLLDRITLGVTVPFVRRRVDSLLRLLPSGSNVGVNPGQASPAAVAAFLSGTTSAIDFLETAVLTTCADLGAEHPECLAGGVLIGEAEGFLGQISAAYSQESIFPLLGSPLGNSIAARWQALHTALVGWEASAPDSIPLASAPLDDATFRALYAAPVWPVEGFPLENTPSYLVLGDVELQAAVALLRPAAASSVPQFGAPPPRGGIRIRSALTGTIRFPTGATDSLRVVAPMDPPAGVGGLDLGLQTDFLLHRRFALHTVVEAGWNGSREMLLLLPDPTRVFDPGLTSAQVRWEPGNRMRVSLTPRIHIGSALSLGVGWEFIRAEADQFSPLEGGGPALPDSDETQSRHRGGIELRYTVMQGEIAEAARFPFEAFFRASRTLSGTGQGTPVDRRLDAGLRFLLRR